jgi:hypothetical protein
MSGKLLNREGGDSQPEAVIGSGPFTPSRVNGSRRVANEKKISGP